MIQLTSNLMSSCMFNKSFQSLSSKPILTLLTKPYPHLISHVNKEETSSEIKNKFLIAVGVLPIVRNELCELSAFISCTFTNCNRFYRCKLQKKIKMIS